MATKKVERTGWNAKELHNTVMAPVKWLIESIHPQGLSLLGGRPKIGKSFLEFQKCIAIANPEGELFGYKACTGKVLYISLEDNPRRLKVRLERILESLHVKNLDWLENLEIETKWKRFDQGGDKELLERLSKNRYAYCAIDTFKKAYPVKDNDAGVVTQLLTPIHNFTKKGETSIEFVDHHRKIGQFSGDFIEDISGSQGKGGVADTIWGLYRERSDRKANLGIVSRDTEEEGFDLVFDRETTLWVKKGNVKENTIQSRIVEYVKSSGSQTYITQMAEALGISQSLCSREMAQLVGKGVMESGDKQGTKIPYYFVNGGKARKQ